MVTQTSDDEQERVSPKRTVQASGSTTEAINSVSFYGNLSNSQSKYSSSYAPPSTPPALPRRHNEPGVLESSTAYQTNDPRQYSFGGSFYREPEFIPSEDMSQQNLTSAASFQSSSNTQSQWVGTNEPWGEPAWGSTTNDTWGHPGDAMLTDFPDVPIDGRDMQKERRWWDSDFIGTSFPGPGFLPPLVTEMLHNSEHALVSISVSAPDITPAPASSSSPNASATSPPSLSQQSSKDPGHSRSSSVAQEFSAPTPQEIREAVPHPNAYYCRRHNGWILLLWRTSNLYPPLIEKNLQSPLPPIRPGPPSNCHTYSGRAVNKTNHFHRYQKVVDADNITPAYVPRQWERPESSKRSRRRITFGSDDLDPELVARAVAGDAQSQAETNKITEAREEEDARILMDLYVCCQCALYVLVSDVIPGVIPAKIVDVFTQEKRANPTIGKTGLQSIHNAWETVLTIIENLLWKNKTGALSVKGKAFSSKIGWSSNTASLFQALGFKFVNGTDNNKILQPPDINKSTEAGKANFGKLLRAWVEIGAITLDIRRSYPSVLKDYNPHQVCVKAASAREEYQTALGAHVDQLPRGKWPNELRNYSLPESDWEKLGMTKSTYDEELLAFAYLAQCRCDPGNTPEYLEALCRIVGAFQNIGQVPASLDLLIGSERSRGRFSSSDVENAARVLGFGNDNDLKLEYDDETEDEFIRNAWQSAIRRSWKDIEGAAKRHDLNEAFRIIAENRRSMPLVREYEEDQIHGMTPKEAYESLGMPEGIEEEMIIPVYMMRVEEKPSQLEKMRDALRVIAEYTSSDRLKKFLEIGTDPGPLIAQTPHEWPRGLNQLGNTCYLNSLLQYFYTIKELREAIEPLAVEDKLPNVDELKDDDLKKHRVGGRMVSKLEVLRSRRFVSRLAELFSQLENTTAPSVTPSLELAKLALVTSKDEEEEEQEHGGTDSSNSTDATLVDEPAPVRSGSPVQQKSPSQGASSVLGKRARGFRFGRHKDKGTDTESMEELDKNKEDYVLVSKASGSNTPVIATAEGEDDIRMEHVTEVDAQAQEAPTAKAPPLPPRPKTQTSGSEMMFGKQHDVAECMDNCIFQIETALLRTGQLADDIDDDKHSVVKRLFYGKIRQRLALPPDPKRSKSSVHDREDYFAHLPVNVSSESFDIYDGLSGYFEDDVEFEGTKAKMHVSIVGLPQILQIQLQRVQFNRETFSAYKSHAYVKFGETLYMDRFLDNAPQDKKERAKEIQGELNACRERIQELTQGKYAPFEENLDAALSFLTEKGEVEFPEATIEILSSLQNEKTNVALELEAQRARIIALKTQLEDVWSDERRAEYELTSVFIHRGSSPSFGHYFIYQRCLPHRPDDWFKYNDSEVTLVSKDEVLADTTGSTANPYLLVYARKDFELIDTIRRSETEIMSLD